MSPSDESAATGTDSTCEAVLSNPTAFFVAAYRFCIPCAGLGQNSVFNVPLRNTNSYQLPTKQLMAAHHTFRHRVCKVAQNAHSSHFRRFSINSLYHQQLNKYARIGRKFALLGGDMKPARFLTVVALVAMFAAPLLPNHGAASSTIRSVNRSHADAQAPNPLSFAPNQATARRCVNHLAQGRRVKSEFPALDAITAEISCADLKALAGFRETASVSDNARIHGHQLDARRQRRHFRPSRPSTQGRWRRTRSCPPRRQPTCRR